MCAVLLEGSHCVRVLQERRCAARGMMTTQGPSCSFACSSLHICKCNNLDLEAAVVGLSHLMLCYYLKSSQEQCTQRCWLLASLASELWARHHSTECIHLQTPSTEQVHADEIDLTMQLNVDGRIMLCDARHHLLRQLLERMSSGSSFLIPATRDGFAEQFHSGSPNEPWSPGRCQTIRPPFW